MDARVEKNKIPPVVGSVYDGPDPKQLEGFVFATARPADQGGFVDWFYLNERANQDAYNFSVDYIYNDKTYPRLTRTYVLLREGLVEPQVNTADPIYAGLQLTDHKQLRIENDPVLDSLFVVVQRVYEILPGPIITTFQENQFQQIVSVAEQELATGTVATPSATTEIAKTERTGTAKLKATKGDTDIVFNQLELSIERNESIIPYVFQSLFPRYKTSQVVAGQVVQPTLAAGEWGATEKQLTLYKKLVERISRGFTGFAQLVGYLLTRDQQVATVTETWSQSKQFITPRATLIDASVDDWGDAGTLKKEVEVPNVFAEGQFSIEVADPVPPEFQYLSPTTIIEVTAPGIAVLAPLGPGEVQHTETQKTELIKRTRIVGHDLGALPRTLVDQELTEAFGFGGKANVTRTLDIVPQQVDEGILVLDSKVKHLPGGLTLKETTAIAGGGAHVDVTNGGSGYTSPPAVSFSGGLAAGGAAAVGALAPANSGTDAPRGGTFTLALGTPGDQNGVFRKIGELHNGGVWKNPALIAGAVTIDWAAGPSGDREHVHYETADLWYLVDGQPAIITSLYDNAAESTVYVGTNPVTTPAFSYGVLVTDLGPATTLTATVLTIQRNGIDRATAARVNVLGSNDGENFDLLVTDELLANNDPLEWNTVNLPGTTAYRYYMIRRTNGDTSENIFAIGEFEFYGELVVVPSVTLNYANNGDANGAFRYLGALGNGGTWRNPHTNGDITITAPYDTLELGTFDSMVDTLSSNTYFRARSGAECWFNLGTGRALYMTHFSFRQRANYNSSMQEIDVQGSHDGVTWGYSFTAPVSGTAGAWTTVDVRGTAMSNERYRYFRIILHPPNSFLAVGEFEIYGTLVLPVPTEGGLVLSEIRVTSGGAYLTAPTVVITGGGGTGATAVAQLTSGAVSGVTIISRGTGYTTAPTISFAGGNGSAAVAHSVLGFPVKRVTMTTPGSGYSYPPPVIITPNPADTLAGGAIGVAVLSSGVGVVEVVTPGTGYTSNPTVALTGGGGGTGAAATAQRGFPIATIAMSAGGSGYLTAPTVQITGDGEGASAHVIFGAALTTPVISNPGSGYTSDPTVVFTGGGGTGAAATVTRSFGVASIGLTAPGTGYTSNPAVALSGGGGTGATATTTRTFSVASAVVTAGGSGYTAATVVFSAPPVGGTTATGTVTVASGAVTGITITDPGSGYTTAPTATISGDGTLATANAVLATSGPVSGFVITNAGSGYTSPPTVAITGGGGSGAEGDAVVNTAGRIQSIAMTNFGSGYSSAPAISFTGGAGTGAAAITSLGSSSGIISGVVIDNPGKGFTTAPTIAFVGGGGTGAAATSTLGTTGTIKTVTVTVPGTGYLTPPTVGFTGGGGTGATARSVSAGTGQVAGVSITHGGTKYTLPPTITFLPAGTGGTGAAGTAVLDTVGQVAAVVIDTDGIYLVAPTVSFSGGAGTGAAGVYVFDAGWPVLYQVSIDEVTKIAVEIKKEMVPAGTRYVAGSGFVEIQTVDKWRSIRLTSTVNEATLPAPEVFASWVNFNFPSKLLSVEGEWSAQSSEKTAGQNYDGTFQSVSNSASVSGGAFVLIENGYNGPCRAETTRTYMIGPPTCCNLPDPLLILPSTGSAVVHGSGGSSEVTTRPTSPFSVEGGTPPAPLSSATSVSSSTRIFQIGPVLTGAYQIANSAVAGGSLVVRLPISTPTQFNSGEVFVAEVRVTKMRFDIWMIEVVRITVPVADCICDLPPEELGPITAVAYDGIITTAPLSSGSTYLIA